jgi:tetratricopeptide (TPR) repeat protein
MPVQSQLRKNLFMGACMLAAAVYISLASLQYLAAYFSQKPDLVSLQRAAGLQPGNAEYRYHVGRYLWLFQLSPQQALESYRASVTLNPHKARYWLDLAEVYRNMGNSSEQKAALENAINSDPKTPDVAWEAANFYLVQGETERALREFHVVLENDLSLAPAALQLCLRVSPGVETLLQQVIPPSPPVYFALLDILMAKKQTADAAKVWDQLAKLRQPLETRRVFEYLRFLISQKETDQARRVWQDASSLCGLSAYQPSSENLVVNGDFSLEVLNGGFDWLYQKLPNVSLSLDPTQFHTGHRSLLIVFDGRGVEDAGIRQLLPVDSNASYEFSAYFKSEVIQGAGGPRFVIQDLYNNTVYLASDELKDADFWKQVGGTFTTGPTTKMLVLRVQRVPPGSPIRGKLWIDGVRLIPKTTMSAQ